MFWKRKKQTKSNHDEHEIIGALLQAFMNNGDLDPVFVNGIRSEKDAEAINWKKLPLIYLWNEYEDDDQVGYSLSINGPLVGAMLEATVSRNDPAFDDLRDKAMSTFRDLATSAVSETCIKTGLKPSELFSPS